MFGILESGIGEQCGTVECEIEVLYDILALGVLEKMKTHPGQAMPAKVQKAGFALAVSGALAGQLWPALPRSGSGLSVCCAAWFWLALLWPAQYFVLHSCYAAHILFDLQSTFTLHLCGLLQ